MEPDGDQRHTKQIFVFLYPNRSQKRFASWLFRAAASWEFTLKPQLPVLNLPCNNCIHNKDFKIDNFQITFAPW